MRPCLLTAAAVMLLSGTAHAQQSASSFLSGIPADQIKNKPLDLSKAIYGAPAQSALTGNRFDFSALFSKKIIPSATPVRGISPLPPASSFPSTKYPSGRMVGNPPYLLNWMFGGSNGNAIQPVKPFTATSRTAVGPGSGN